ncbi:MAG: hypothetical protein IJD35_04455 [Clostridia bacterium]|nr:hypothetical protein [Clostridia bacterium]
MKTVKHLSVLLAVLVVVSLFVIGFVVNAEAPITISNAEEFRTKMVAANAGATFELTGDIDLGTLGNVSFPANFTGTFDGKGHAISGLTEALFGVIDGGVVKNVTLNGFINVVTEDNETSNEAGRKIGSVAKEAIGGAEIQNVISNVDISISAYNANAGGIVGYAEMATLTKLTYAGNLHVTCRNVDIAPGAFVAGIVAYAFNDGGVNLYQDCTFAKTATITVDGDSEGLIYVASILGCAEGGVNDVSRALNDGTITLNIATARYSFGGISGYMANGISSITGSLVAGSHTLGSGVNASRPLFCGGGLQQCTGAGLMGTDSYLANDGEGLAMVFAHMNPNATVKVNGDLQLPENMPTYTKGAFTGLLESNGSQQCALFGITNPLFEKIAGGTVKNLILEGTIDYSTKDETELKITENPGKDIRRKAAAIAQEATDGAKFENVSCYVDIKTYATDLNAGGIVGYAKDVSFSNVTYAGNITAIDHPGSNGAIGGMVGYINAGQKNVSFTNCSFTGTLTVDGAFENKELYVGALIGKVKNALTNVTGFTNEGVITVNTTAGNVFVGGMVGINDKDSNAQSTFRASGTMKGTITLGKDTVATADPFLAKDIAGNANLDSCVYNVSAFSNGKIEKGSSNAYTIDSDDFSAFVSARAGAEGTTDYRFIIAADIKKFAEYDNVDMILTFTKGGEVVASATKDILTELDIYRSATAAGNTYVAADGCLLFGLVVTGVPADAWDTVTVTLANGLPLVSGELAATDVTVG